MLPDDVTIILVSFNSASVISQQHDALCRAGGPQVIFVDNASPDGSAKTLAERYPEATHLPQARNLGYGRATNVGLRACATPYALLLNPDIAAPSESIAQLAQHIRKGAPNNATICGPATCHADHRPGAEPIQVKWVSGCAMLFDVEKVRAVGLFDERIFLYSEETELCQRIVAGGGHILRCDDVLFEHHVGESSGSSPAIDRMRWWHFGWSNAYRMTKHGQITFWKNPWRKQWGNRLQGWLARDPAAKLKWHAKADGIRAFRQGVQAFDQEGHPMMSGPVRAAQANQD